MQSPIAKVLHIDLANRKHEVVERPELFDTYLGGSGVAVRLFSEECPRGIDPFSPENPIVFATGPLNGLYPSVVKTVAFFKSPITGNLGESHAGGRLATSLRLTGYAALIVKGFTESPTFLAISDTGVEFNDATPLTGLSQLEVERLLRVHDVAGMQSVLSIGPAGERMVFYASVNVDRYNCFGRLGLGAIFGAKNLKAISVTGRGMLTVPNPDQYKRVFELVYKEVVETDKMAKYHYTGTPANVLILNEIGALPTKNFQMGRFEHAEKVSGETLGEFWLERKVACALCPIGCMHIAKRKHTFDKGYEYEALDVYHSYESIYALGSNLYIGDAEAVLRLIHTANTQGIDTMLLGNALAWATEAFEKGLITTQETGGLSPSWGDTETYLKMVENLVHMSNDFYAKLAQGVEPAAETYGGSDFAMALCCNGLAGYHTGYAAILGTIVGARHSHNSNAGYAIDQEALREGMTRSQIVDGLMREEDWRYVLTSLVACLFARHVYTEKLVVETLKTVGVERSLEELMRLGSETYKTAFTFKFGEGFNFRRVRIPERVFQSLTASGELERGTLMNMLAEYVVKRFGTEL